VATDEIVAAAREPLAIDSRPMQRLATLGILIALATTGVVIVSLIAGFQQLLLHPFAMFGSILIAAAMSLIFLKVALVPSQRYTGWVRTVTGPNGRWLFLVLLLLWGGAMAFLASMGLGPQQIGSPALVGLFAGVFLFMGFIWSVIGE
jgi:hypothetical protein